MLAKLIPLSITSTPASRSGSRTGVLNSDGTRGASAHGPCWTQLLSWCRRPLAIICTNMRICPIIRRRRHRLLRTEHMPWISGLWSCARARTTRTAMGDSGRILRPATGSALRSSERPPTTVWRPTMRRTPIRRSDGHHPFNGPHEVTSCIYVCQLAKLH